MNELEMWIDNRRWVTECAHFTRATRVVPGHRLVTNKPFKIFIAVEKRAVVSWEPAWAQFGSDALENFRVLQLELKLQTCSEDYGLQERRTDTLLQSGSKGGQLVVWLKFRPTDRRVAGSIPDSTNFLTNSSEQATNALVSLFTKQ